MTEAVRIKFDDRARDSVLNIPGTGSFTLAATPPGGYRDFTDAASPFADGDYLYYSANLSGDWEVGLGKFATAGPSISREIVLSSSNSNNLVNFTASGADIFCVNPASQIEDLSDLTFTVQTTSSAAVDCDLHGTSGYHIRLPDLDTAMLVDVTAVSYQTAGSAGTPGQLMLYSRHMMMVVNDGGAFTERQDLVFHELTGGLTAGNVTISGLIDLANNRYKLQVAGATNYTIDHKLRVKVMRVP